MIILVLLTFVTLPAATRFLRCLDRELNSLLLGQIGHRYCLNIDRYFCCSIFQAGNWMPMNLLLENVSHCLHSKLKANYNKYVYGASLCGTEVILNNKRAD